MILDISRWILEKKTEIPNFTKTRLIGTEVLHADGQTDRRIDRQDEANSRFSQSFEKV